MKDQLDWSSKHSTVVFNPAVRLDENTEQLPSMAEGHVWLATSGTTQGRRKWVGLSKAALLASAEAVNRHLRASASDIWLNPLPVFHVGGLGILARAGLTGSEVHASGPWAPENFVDALKRHRATLTALVPTQVYDLVAGEFQAPSDLRAVVVGGGALSPTLYFKARKLGWPLLPSYGLSECSSQVATAALSSLETHEPHLEILDHVRGRCDSDGRLQLRSLGLLSFYAEWDGRWRLHDPKSEGWFTTEDLARIDGSRLTPLGRVTDQVKILGELVNLAALNFVAEKIKNDERLEGDVCLIAHRDERAGYQLDLVTAGMEYRVAERVKRIFNDRVAPFERSTNVYCLRKLPRTELGKIKKAHLLELLGLQELS